MMEKHHYTESGLDNVWLVGGFEIINQGAERQLKIRDIEGLHRVIGTVLADKKGDLTGKEIRFLRQELLMSQALLAKLLGVTEQTVHRWETGKADIPKPAESLIRFIYRGKNVDVRKALEELAEIEDQLDSMNFASKPNWHLQNAA
jgi:DNA-binding transcriptional regulator YiaG